MFIHFSSSSCSVSELEVRKLWRHIQPFFRGLMSRVFLREVSSTQFEQVKSGGSHASLGGVVSSLELPYHSKYLLLSAYIASYNPAKTDRRFFSKVSTIRGATRLDGLVEA